jgi:multimeric flavodoxin WrbA
MKIVFISGSRNPNGQTAHAMGALREGIEGNGGKTEMVYLPTFNLERCRQCEDTGWGICRDEGTCIIEDDFAELVQKIRQADAAVFATPVYFGDLSESMRALTDRLRRTCTHSAGRSGIEQKPAIGVCVAGGGGGGSLSCAMSVDKVLTTCGFNVLDVIPVRRQNLKAHMNRLRLAGAWVMTTLQST